MASAVPRTNDSYTFESALPKPRTSAGQGDGSLLLETIDYCRLNAVLLQAHSGFEPPHILQRSCVWVLEDAASFWLFLCFSSLLKTAEMCLSVCGPVAFLEELLAHPERVLSIIPKNFVLGCVSGCCWATGWHHCIVLDSSVLLQEHPKNVSCPNKKNNQKSSLR